MACETFVGVTIALNQKGFVSRAGNQSRCQCQIPLDVAKKLHWHPFLGIGKDVHSSKPM
ncbi:hypothetical protein HOV93_02200 [Planctomycetes bacterium FF15]|uniref:Uncharacterized protein n=1 Tax=Bremerella alba TaxID=980252 RepID=A0A7V8V190_9BACT|nr:hypothetical protein [Bremerella alba]